MHKKFKKKEIAKFLIFQFLSATVCGNDQLSGRRFANISSLLIETVLANDLGTDLRHQQRPEINLPVVLCGEGNVFKQYTQISDNCN